jgi:hypothetical protein
MENMEFYCKYLRVYQHLFAPKELNYFKLQCGTNSVAEPHNFCETGVRAVTRCGSDTVNKT